MRGALVLCEAAGDARVDPAPVTDAPHRDRSVRVIHLGHDPVVANTQLAQTPEAATEFL